MNYNPVAKNVFLTGATGFLGKHVANILLSRGYKVRAAYREKSRCFNDKNINWVLCNFDERLDSSLLKDISIVINCAAYGVDPRDNLDEKKAFRVNYEAAVELYNMAEINAVEQFIQIGSCFEYGHVENKQICESHFCKPTTVYGVSKFKMTNFIQSYKTKVRSCILRPFGLWGAGESGYRLVPQILEASKTNKELHLTPGLQVRDYSYVRDVAEWIIKLVDLNNYNSGEIINLGSGTPTTLLDFAYKIAKVVSAEHLLKFGAIPYRQNEMMNLVSDNRRLIELIGELKTTSVEEGVREMLRAS